MTKNITIGIPFYKKTNPLHLKAAIESIVNQTLEPKLIHLIQDGPINQNLKEIVQYYNKRHSNMKILKLPKKGLPYALNQSILSSDTKYYGRMDSDDIAFKGRIEKQIKFLEKNDKVDILGAWAVEFEDENELEKGMVIKRTEDPDKIREYFHYMNPLIHPSVIFRLDVFKKIGLYNEKFYTDQDLELWSRALKKNVGISNIQEPLLYFRTDGRHNRRSKYSAILRQILARYSYNTISVKLNILKISAILFRLMPSCIKEWGYKNLRG